MIQPNSYPRTYSPNYNTITVDLRGAKAYQCEMTVDRPMNGLAVLPLIGPVVALYRATLGVADIVAGLGRNSAQAWIGTKNVQRAGVELTPTIALVVVSRYTQSYLLSSLVWVVLRVALVILMAYWSTPTLEDTWFQPPAILYYDNVAVRRLTSGVFSGRNEKMVSRSHSEWVKHLTENGTAIPESEQCHFV